MLRSLIDLYRQSLKYALACPLLFLIPVAAEAAQHVAEYAQGFYANVEAARALEHSMLRISFGTIKVLTLLLTGYWVVRWLEWHDPTLTARLDIPSIRTFLPLVIFHLVLTLPGVWGPVLVPSLAKPLLLFSLGILLLTPLLAYWQRSAPIGKKDGPISSIRHIARFYLWACTYKIMAILPPMMLHYTFSIGALKSDGIIQAICLVADTIIVGYIGTVLSAVPWFIVEHVRTQAPSNRNTDPAPKTVL